MSLTTQEKKDIKDILSRRANEIALFKNEFMKDKSHLGSVELALTREMQRLRDLADKVFIEE
jgi:hypothetical protein